MVANDQAGRDAYLWLTPHELEKEFNAAKQVNQSLGFVTGVSKFVAQGACRNYRNARSRWLRKKPESPPAGIPQEEPHRHWLVPGRFRYKAYPLRRTSPNSTALPGQREDNPPIAGRHPVRGHHPPP